MGKLDDFNEKDTKRRNLVVTIAVTVLIAAFIVTAFIADSYKHDERKIDEDVVVGVHIKGAVKNGGYYEVPLGTRVRDLIDTAGGFDENAFEDGVNLAGYVKDGEEIVIPYKGTVEKGALNLNVVSQEELCELVDGIGEDSARKIIAYREAHNGFVSVLELDEILGKSKAKALYDKFYVD